MNKIFKSKWNVATQSYVACSELTRRAGKTVVGASVLATTVFGFIPTADAAECSSWDIKNNVTCEITVSEKEAPVTSGGTSVLNLGAAGITRNINVSIENDITLKGNVEQSARNYSLHPKGISVNGNLGSADLKAENAVVNIKLTEPVNNTVDIPVIGLIATNGGTFTGKELNVDVTADNVKQQTVTSIFDGFREYMIQNTLKDAYTESYGVQVGTGIKGEDARADVTSKVTVDDATINVTSSADSDGAYQLSGIRVIRNEENGGSNAIFTSKGNLTINVTDGSDNKSGGYLNGIYVSGNDNKVVLNNSNIKVETEAASTVRNDVTHNGSNSAALKIGKRRDTGTNGATIESNGHMVLDTTKATLAPTVRLVGSNSKLLANYSNSSAEIKSAGTAIEYSASDLSSAEDLMAAAMANDGVVMPTLPEENQVAAFKNAKITTFDDATKALIQVNPYSTSSILSFEGDESSVVASKKAYLINVDGDVNNKASILTVNAKDSGSIIGLTNKTDDATLNVNLSDNFTWYLREHTDENNDPVKRTTVTKLTLNSGATLDAVVEKLDSGSDFIVKGDVTSNAGIINLANNRWNDKLTIDGNYDTLAGGGKVYMNTNWNAAGADSVGGGSESDYLHIKGNTSGTSTVVPIVGNNRDTAFITGDIAPVPVETPDPTKSFNTTVVVKVDGKEEAGRGNSFVGTAGTQNAGELQLTSRESADGGQEYFWTIYAEMQKPTTPVNPADPNTPGDKPLILTPIVPIYQGTGKANLELGYTSMGSLHERRGENQALAWDSCGCVQQYATDQAWVRLFGKRLDLNGKYRFDMEQEQYGIQAGWDFSIRYNPENGSRHHTGAYLGYARGETDHFDRFRAVNGFVVDDKFVGKTKTNAYSLGLSHTRYAKHGGYVDIVGQFSYLDNAHQARNASEASKQKGYAAALSAEVGRPYAVKNTNWIVEPQAQLVYQFLHLNGFNDGTYQVKAADNHGLRGRLGFRLAHNSARGLYTNTFYFTANVLQDLTTTKSTQIGTGNYSEKYNRTWLDLGVGTQLPISKHSYIYGSAHYERNLGGEKRQGYRANVGYKYTW